MILDLFKRTIAKLEDNDFTYMLSGSLAQNEYTVPRMTLDIDIVIELSVDDIDVFFQVFNEGVYINKDTVIEEVKRKGMFNVIDYKTSLKIDFIVVDNSEYRKNEMGRRIRKSLYGMDLWMVSVEDLIVSKIIWIQQLQSDKHINDIKNLLSNPKADHTYIIKWCKKLELKTNGLL